MSVCFESPKMGSGMARKKCICANECPDKAHLIALTTLAAVAILPSGLFSDFASLVRFLGRAAAPRPDGASEVDAAARQKSP
jgi:hypothetical protein